MVFLATINFCRNCDRYLSPPQAWTIAEPESRELLAICLKKLKGLNKVRLIDASFIWTEPHSKRLRVKLTIQKEVLSSTILQQIFEIDYVILYGQCPDCTRLAAKNTWKAVVQVRQKVPHKRTFLYLEQLILKHGADKDTLNIKEVKDGLDFFYAQRSHAIKMVEFLSAVVPVKTKDSEQLLSKDTHSNTSNYKFTYSVELAPICKDDLVCIPPKQARSLSNISPLTICARVGNSLHLLDPQTLRTADISAPIYWRTPFDSLATVYDLVEFIVLDIEPSGRTKGKYVLADAQVVLSGGGMDIDMGDEGGRDTVFHTRTHLGGVLQPGDTVMGYHLTRSNFNNTSFDTLDSAMIPDVILIKKTYPNRRKKNKVRKWRLKSIAKEAEEQPGEGRGALGRRGGLDQERVERDYELFLRDLEEDPELRSTVNLYKTDVDMSGDTEKKGGKKKSQYAMDVEDEPPVVQQDNGEEDEVDFPEIKLDELLDDMEGLDIKDE
ncbi:hypothetical protein FRC02_011167 [Tulasnella sp. 418]|nr:hypothetical protein FRC02_011167 [Tulasnella sp. 418]